jgi:hypothetical protein
VGLPIRNSCREYCRVWSRVAGSRRRGRMVLDATRRLKGKAPAVGLTSLLNTRDSQYLSPISMCSKANTARRRSTKCRAPSKRRWSACWAFRPKGLLPARSHCCLGAGFFTHPTPGQGAAYWPSRRRKPARLIENPMPALTTSNSLNLNDRISAPDARRCFSSMSVPCLRSRGTSL